jgi:hypothetical protein
MSWEYEGLFDAMADPTSGDLLSDYWKSQPSATRVGKMGYRTRTTKAGPRLEVEIYPIFGREQERRARTAKQSQTREKQQRLNDERSRRHFVQLLDANFTKDDISITMTYQTAPGYDRAKKDVRNFIDRVRRTREKRGLPELKYAGSIEDEQDGRRTRIHIHMVMSGGIERDELEKIWAKGLVNADRLQPNENGLEAIGRYIIKQQKNRHRWLASRNLKQPKTRTSDTKASNGRVKRIANGFQNEAKEVLEKMYRDYTYSKSSVYYSDVVDGVYIRCVMRRKE